MSTVKGIIGSKGKKFVLSQPSKSALAFMNSSLMPTLRDCQYPKKRGYINLLAIQKRSMPKTIVKLRDLVFKAKIKVGIATNSSG